MKKNKSLSNLFSKYKTLNKFTDVNVSGICVDSRKVAEGDVFVATSDRIDGHEFIEDAINQGAVAVVGTQELELGVPYVQVEDSREALAYISAMFFDNPADELVLIGVTGTDGKTTTVNLIFNILNTAGIKAGMISTVNAVIGDEALDTGFHVTTPEIFEIMKYLRQMADAGLTHAVLETTSHGLASKRVIGSDFDIGVVTNITHEHLDFHGSFENYRDSKALLFNGLGMGEKKTGIEPLAVLNMDDDNYQFLKEGTQVKSVGYGINPDAELRAENIKNTADMLSFRIVGANLNMSVQTSLIGNYNASNILAAVGATVYGLGISPLYAERGIASLKSIPGRMERVNTGQEFSAIVDFAHTPNALKSVLQTAREITVGNVIAVFGSAGLRDQEKRRLMAEVSAEYADITVLTAEDPRTESLDEILAEMAVGAVSKGAKDRQDLFRIRDRGAAIRFAVKRAKEDDLVIVLGKGHEQSMCFIDIEYPWDDVTAVKAALAEKLDIEGPDMPFLPTQDNRILLP